MRDAPVIDPRFLEWDADFRRLKAGLKKTQEIMKSAPINKAVVKELVFGDITDEAKLDHAIRDLGYGLSPYGHLPHGFG